MLTTEKAHACATEARPVSIIEQLKMLPPPWEASPEAIAEVANRVGFPIVYEAGEDPGWHAVMNFEGVRRNFDKPAPRRYEQLRRTFEVIAFLGARTLGATLQEIQEETHPEGCERTTRRDLILLMELGMVDRVREGDAVRYRWNDRSTKAAVLHHVAQAQELVY